MLIALNYQEWNAQSEKYCNLIAYIKICCLFLWKMITVLANN